MASNVFDRAKEIVRNFNLGGFFQPPVSSRPPSIVKGHPSQMKLTVGISPNFVNNIQAASPAPAIQPPIANYSGLGRNPDLPKKPLSPQVQNAILQAAKEFKVPHQLLFDIAYSEGGFRPDAKNETEEGKKVGIPVGLFQFTPGSWNSDVYNYARMPNTSLKNFLVNGQMPAREDPLANARAAAYLIKFGQLARWDASLPNWGRFYQDDEIADYYSQSPGHSKRRNK